MLQRLCWVNKTRVCVRSCDWVFDVDVGEHTASGLLHQFIDQQRGIERSLGIMRFVWNFYDIDGVWWRHSVLLQPEDWMPETTWGIRVIEQVWPRSGPSIFPVRLLPGAAAMLGKLLECRNAERLLWSFRWGITQESSYFTIQMGAHRTRMDDLNDPVGIWEYLLPFSHWLWRPCARVSETTVLPQGGRWCDIERVGGSAKNEASWRSRGLGRSPVCVKRVS